MTFLFSAMLAGLAAVAIPALLHLIARQKFPVQPFPSTLLINPELRTNAYAMRPVDLLQLLLRMLIVAAVVLALARPVLLNSAVGRSSRNIVVVLDCSPSMLARQPNADGGDQTMFDRAKQTAAALLGSAGPHDRVAFIEAGGAGVAVPLSVDSHAAVERALRARVRCRGIDAGTSFPAPASPGRRTNGKAVGGIGEAIGEACRMVASRREFSSEIYVLSDMRRNILDDWDEECRAALADAQTRLGDRLVLRFVDLGARELPNLGITNVKLTPGRIGPGSDAHLAATIRNFADEDRDVSLELFVRRTAKAKRTVTVPAASSAVVDVPTSFDAAMNTSCRLEIGADDALPLDDRYYVPIRIDRQFKVLIIDGTEADESAESGGADGSQAAELSGAAKLEFALNPAQFAASEGRGRIRSSNIERVTLGAVGSAMIGTYQLVVLYQVSALPSRTMQDIEDLVENGGSLLIIPGEGVDLIDLRKNFTERGDRLRLCPAAIGNAVAIEPGTKLTLGDDIHPVMEPFVDLMKGDLNTVTFKRLYELQPAEGAAVVFRVGHMPAVVEMQAGDGRGATRQSSPRRSGRICVCGFGLEREWTDLAATRVFVPLIWRLTDYLAGRLDPLPMDTVRLGKRLVVDASDFSPAPYVSILAADGTPWRGPDGWPLEMPLGETGTTVVGGLTELGPYMLTTQGQVAVDVALADGTSVSGSADTAAVRAVLKPSQAMLPGPPDGKADAINVRSPGASVRIDRKQVAGGDFGTAITLRGIQVIMADGTKLEGAIGARELDDALAGRRESVTIQTGGSARVVHVSEVSGGSFAEAVRFASVRAVDRKTRFVCVNLPAGETDTRQIDDQALAAAFAGQKWETVSADAAVREPVRASEIWYLLAMVLLIAYIAEAAVGHWASRRQEQSRAG